MIFAISIQQTAHLSRVSPLLFYVFQLRVQRSVCFSPVREDVSHGPRILIKSQMEAIGVDLWTV